MLDNKLSKIKINGVRYPYKCDLTVLEKIQKEYGDLLRYEYGIRGLVPYFDEDTGVRDAKKDRYTAPNVEMVCKSLAWMIEEGIAIKGADFKPPTETEIKRQQDFILNDLALLVYKEYANCFFTAMSKPKKSRKGTKKKHRKKKK